MNKIIKVILVNACLVAISASFIYGMSMLKNNGDDQASSTAIKKAPLFTAKDSNGKSHNLADYKGKIVVLEWKNHLCPFVKKHYGSNNMQTLQKKLTSKGVIWLSIISSAENRQGYVTPDECNEIVKNEGSHATAVLLDPEGKIGRQYQAKTTPHMFVIDAAGNIVYEGAIDSIRSADPNDIKKAKNYVLNAVDSVIKQKTIEPAQTATYGCSVKYAY